MATAQPATPNAYDSSADYLKSAGGAFTNAATQGPTQVGSYGPKDISKDVFTNINQYLNPYYDQVLNSALGRMGDTYQQNLNEVGANATAAGAFGGARHGLVEATLGSEYQKNAGELTGNLKAQGFNNALNTSLGVTGAELGRGQYLTGLQTSADQFGQSLNFQGGQALQGLGNDYFNIGNSIVSSQLGQGGLQQNLSQNVIDKASGQFNQNMQTPNDVINFLNAILTQSPRAGNVQTYSSGTQSGTSTQTTQPGLYDVISLLLQAGPDALKLGFPG